MNDHHFDDGGRRPPRFTAAQVIALGIVAASIGWSVWLLRERPISEEVELLPGTVLPSSEMAIVEAAFDRAQLTDHRTEDGRVWVPRSRQSGYMRALVDAEALPREFGSSLRRALENNSPWQSRAVHEELLRVAIQEELAHVICSMPGIERAAVLYDVDERPGAGGLGGGPERTASVNVRTQADVELEPGRVQAIRVLVASSIAGLTPDRVAVTDLRNGRVHVGPLEPPADDDTAAVDPELARRIAHERHLAAKVRQALAFVKGAVVDVTVTFAPPVSAPQLAEPAAAPAAAQRVADANAPAAVATDEPDDPAADVAGVAPPADGPRADVPDTIVVTLAVPETWFEVDERVAADRESAPATVNLRVEDHLRRHVLDILPTTSTPDGRRVIVRRFPIAAGRRAQPAQPPAAVRQAAAPAGALPAPRTPGEFVDATWRALAAGRPADVPREAWFGVIAVCATLLAWLVLRGWTERSATAARGRRGGRIDWTNIDAVRTSAGLPADEDRPHRQAAA